MPLRDHFRPPVALSAAWEVHGGWPMVIVQSLARRLPRRYVAHPLRAANLYEELLGLIGQNDPVLGDEPPSTYAVACRATKPSAKPGADWQLEAWFETLVVGRRLPTLPLWLTDKFSVPLDLEESYEATCSALRIA